MKYAVTGMASVTPEGNGIECLNYFLYEGKAPTGQLQQHYYEYPQLLTELDRQLEDKHLQRPVQGLLLADSKAAGLHVDELEGVELITGVSGFLQKLATLEKNPDAILRVYLAELERGTSTLEDSPKENGSPAPAFAQAYVENTNPGVKAHFGLALEIRSTNSLPEGQKVFASFDFLPHAESLQSLAGQELFSLEDISYLELVGADCRLIPELLELFSGKPFSCAMGSVANIFSYDVKHLWFLSLVKLSLQCYHRYISGISAWQEPDDTFPWEKSNFYFPEQSRSWFVATSDTPRQALAVLDDSKTALCFRVSDEYVGLDRENEFFAYAAPHLFPVTGDTLDDLLQGVEQLKQDLESCHSFIQIRRLAKQYYQEILDEEDQIKIRAYRLVILAQDKKAIYEEITLLHDGLEKIFSRAPNGEKTEIKTPKGSYFTSEPLGDEGKVAFVFPGLGSSYIGLGQKIFQLFPSIFKESFRFTNNVGEELQETQLYPRTLKALSFKEKRQRDMAMVMNLKDLGKTDTTYSCICAHVMTDVFQLRPDMAFGYSMGEANMVTALDVWKKPTELEARFKASEIFKRKLYGPMETVREFWSMEDDTATEDDSIWGTFTLKAKAEDVRIAIRELKLEKVYLTLINTDDNVVIAGEPATCFRLIQHMDCRAIPMGFVPAIHCEITAKEYQGIAELYSLETTGHCETKLYSSSCYLPVPVRQKAIAYSIAKCFCEPVDFPRLVNKVYHDGARIFLEAGAGRTCSTWIDRILEGKKHVIVPLNAKGTDDSLTFARVMAKLFCHKVNVDLSPLYENVYLKR